MELGLLFGWVVGDRVGIPVCSYIVTKSRAGNQIEITYGHWKGHTESGCINSVIKSKIHLLLEKKKVQKLNRTFASCNQPSPTFTRQLAVILRGTMSKETLKSGPSTIYFNHIWMKENSKTKKLRKNSELVFCITCLMPSSLFDVYNSFYYCGVGNF